MPPPRLGALNAPLQIDQSGFAHVALGWSPQLVVEFAVVRVLFFGRLRDQVGEAERDVALGDAVELARFRDFAAAGDADLAEALAAPHIRVAINAALIAPTAAAMVAPGDEVAFMPPFSGG